MICPSHLHHDGLLGKQIVLLAMSFSAFAFTMKTGVVIVMLAFTKGMGNLGDLLAKFFFTMKTRAIGVLLTFAFSNMSNSKPNDFLFFTFTMNNESEVLA